MCKKMTTLILALGMSLMIISANAGTISYVQITSDADCGISPDNTYTHTLDFGTGSPGALVNGVQFDAYNNAALGTLNFNREAESGSLSDHGGNGSHNVSGGLVDLMTDMYYNGGNAPGGVTTWTLSGLAPGKTYHARIYTRMWGASDDRNVTFVFDPDGAGPVSDSTGLVSQDNATSVGFANGNDAYYINYQFKAVSGQDLVISLSQDNDNYSWHLYGLTNQEFSSETASALLPENEATDVLRDADLSWAPGDYAATHNVYVGDSFDEVDAATVPTSADLTVTSLDPGRMEFGKTYFWRVDEVNGTPDKTVFKGDVWSFEVEPYSILIPGSAISATASSVSNDFSTPETTINGAGLDASGAHDIAAENMWFTAAVDLDPWIQYEFDDVMKLDIMTVWNSNGAAESAIGWGAKDVEVAYSVDGENWDALEAIQLSRASGFPTYNQPDTIAFNGAAAKYVRLNIQSNWGGILMAYGLSEVQFAMIPAKARTPEPTLGSLDVLPTATIQWRAGREADQHTIYVGTDQNAVADGSASSVASSTNSLDLASLDLELDQAYYWRVDEVNEAEAVSVWAGPVWSFSTVAALTVDDFERYSNDSPDRPFQTWIDGVGFTNPVPGNPGNGSGAAIGHDIWSLGSPDFDETIMETGLAFGGSQSMPVYYDGAGSQVDLAIANENWTQNGLQTLSIAFHGTAGNTGQLYAKIGDTKILYDQDSADVASGSWLVWLIDLSSVSGLDNVTTLSIGVDGAGAAGVLYLDEIKLYAEAGELITPVAPGTENRVAHYAFDGNLQDTAGTHHGTINAGDPVFVDGVNGQGIEFIGNQDVTVAYAEDLSLNSFTISTWVNISDIGGNRGIMGTRYNSDTTFDLKVDANRIHGDVGSGTAWLSTAVDYSTTLSTDTWYHIAYAVEEGSAKIYLNGTLAETITINGVPLFMKADQELHIGNSYGTVEYMYGTLDEVSIYSGTLSAGEVASLAGRTMPIYQPL